MSLFHNLVVKLRVSLCDVLAYVSAQTLVFLDLEKNCSFLNWKPAVPTVTLMDGHYLAEGIQPILDHVFYQARGGGGGGNSPRSKASRAALTGMPASQGTPTWHKPQP